MVRAVRRRLGGLVVATVVAAALYWLVGDPGLAAVAGIVWGVAVLVTLRISGLHPDSATGAEWGDRRWTAVGVGAVTLAALVGVSPTLPVGDSLRFGLGLLVLGSGFAGYATGSMAELERGE